MITLLLTDWFGLLFVGVSVESDIEMPLNRWIVSIEGYRPTTVYGSGRTEHTEKPQKRGIVHKQRNRRQRKRCSSLLYIGEFDVYRVVHYWLCAHMVVVVVIAGWVLQTADWGAPLTCLVLTMFDIKNNHIVRISLEVEYCSNDEWKIQNISLQGGQSWF